MIDSELSGPNIPGIINIDRNCDDVICNNYVHIRVQQRNSRKCITTVEGIDIRFDKKKILKDMKKEFCCNGCIVDQDLGQVLQLQGDQRRRVYDFLVRPPESIVKKESIK